jgi:hypothetical protein
VPRRDQVAVVAALDAIGIAFTVAAVVVLVVADEPVPGWWAVVGLAALLSVATTLVLIRLVVRRQAFAPEAIELAGRLVSSQASEHLVAFARTLHAEALTSGDAGVAALLDAALEKYPPGYGANAP